MSASAVNNAELQGLLTSLQQAHRGELALARLVPVFRSQTDLLQSLPPAFGPALEGILSRIEAGALFTEESCSFSQGDLMAALDVWLQKADLRLDQAKSQSTREAND